MAKAINRLVTLIDGAKPGTAAQTPAATVALFGKHPAYADFFELGLETEGLAHAHGVLFEQGIDNNIVSGVWGDPAESLDRIVDGLRHAFVWSGDQGLVVGRWWPSSDSVGRRRPLLACAGLEGVPVSRIPSVVGDSLDTLQSVAVDVSDKDALNAAVTAAVEDVRGRLPQAPAPGEPPLPPPLDVAWFCNARPDDDLLTILDAVRAADEFAGLRAQHLRLPRLLPEDTDGSTAAAAWAELVRAVLSPGTPFVVLVPAEGGHVDVLAGTPSGLDFVCIQRDDADVVDGPLQDAPEEKRQSLVDLLGQLRDGRSGPPEGEDDGAVARMAATVSDLGKLRETLNGQKVIDTSKSWLQRRDVQIGIGVGCGAVILLLLLLSLPGKKAAPNGETNPNGQAVVEPGNGAGGDEEVVAAQWTGLCQSYFSWAGLFFRKLDEKTLAVWDGAPALTHAMGAIRNAWQDIDRTDPRRVAGQPSADLRQLQTAIPEAVRAEDGRERLAEAARRLTDIEAVLFDKDGAVRTALTAQAEQLRELGLARAARDLEEAADALEAGPKAVAQVTECAVLSTAAEELAAVVPKVSEASRRLAAVELGRVLARFAQRSDRRAAKRLKILHGQQQAILSVTTSLLAFAEGDAAKRLHQPGLEQFETAFLEALGGASPRAADMTRWLKAAKELVLLPEHEDPCAPRRQWLVRLSAMESALAELPDAQRRTLEVDVRDLRERTTSLLRIPVTVAAQETLKTEVGRLTDAFTKMEEHVGLR